MALPLVTKTKPAWDLSPQLSSDGCNPDQSEPEEQHARRLRHTNTSSNIGENKILVVIVKIGIRKLQILKGDKSADGDAIYYRRCSRVWRRINVVVPHRTVKIIRHIHGRVRIGVHSQSIILQHKDQGITGGDGAKVKTLT